MKLLTTEKACQTVTKTETKSTQTKSIQKPIDSVPAQTNTRSINQLEFVSSIKTRISESMIRFTDKPAKGTYPFPDLMIFPKDPLNGVLIPNLKSFYLRPVFVFIPEFYWPQHFPNGRPPCPNCTSSQESVVVNNWISPRRVVLDDQCADLLGFRYAI